MATTPTGKSLTQAARKAAAANNVTEALNMYKQAIPLLLAHSAKFSDSSPEKPSLLSEIATVLDEAERLKARVRDIGSSSSTTGSSSSTTGSSIDGGTICIAGKLSNELGAFAGGNICLSAVCHCGGLNVESTAVSVRCVATAT